MIVSSVIGMNLLALRIGILWDLINSPSMVYDNNSPLGLSSSNSFVNGLILKSYNNEYSPGPTPNF